MNSKDTVKMTNAEFESYVDSALREIYISHWNQSKRVDDKPKFTVVSRSKVRRWVNQFLDFIGIEK